MEASSKLYDATKNSMGEAANSSNENVLVKTEDEKPDVSSLLFIDTYTENQVPALSEINLHSDLKNEFPVDQAVKEETDDSEVIIGNSEECKQIYPNDSKSDESDFNNSPCKINISITDREIGSKPIKCKKCKKLNSELNTARTQEPNSNTKPFNCNICCTAFLKEYNLSLHGRLHSGEKPFSCDVCGKKFPQKRYLHQHSKVHSGEKLFSCRICFKSFTLKSYLIRHEKLHTEEIDSFDCQFCNLKFTKLEDLKKHQKYHYVDISFSCTFCGKHFSKKSNLNKHEKAHQLHNLGGLMLNLKYK